MNAKRLTLACLLLLSMGAAGASGEWEKRIQTYIDAYEKSAESPKPIVYPQLADRVRIQFPEGKIVRISWSSQQSGGKETTGGELYLRSGELFVLQKGEGWNLVTKGDYVYEWSADETEGIRIERNESELVDYALYLTDPALFMTGLYHEYLSNPGAFTRDGPDEEGVVTLRLNEPLEGFESISLTENPFWFRGFSFRNPASHERWVFRISAPEPIPSLPQFLFDQLERIRFEDSALSLTRHMDYL